MKFPPAVVEYLDQRQLRAHRKRPDKYDLPPSLDPTRDVSRERFYRNLVAEEEATFAVLLGTGLIDYCNYRGASVLDIGCGLALVDILLWRAYGCSSIYLLDGDGTRQPSRGFRKDMEAWADVRLAGEMVKANVAADMVGVNVMVAGSDFIPPQVDLVISLRSWGHHYPIATYLDLLKWTGARLIVTDIRNGTDGVEVLASVGFDVVCRVPDPSFKCQRLVFRRTR